MASIPFLLSRTHLCKLPAIPGKWPCFVLNAPGCRHARSSPFVPPVTGKHTAANSVWPRIAVSKYNLGLRPAPLIPVIPGIPVLRAAQWLLDSGIQSETGGFSRYRQTDIARNMPVSTEITGYAVSGLCLLFEESGEENFLLAARRAADFLCLSAWDPESSSMPFELNASGGYSYFFDCGIIARSLLWLYRITNEPLYRSTARKIGISMDRDFASLTAFHPIVLLPCKSPAPYEIWWSKMPGAFQLKAALAWRDLGEEFGDTHFLNLYERMLSFALEHYSETLDNESDEVKKMDRLHAWAYFLEGLQPVADRPAIQFLIRSALAHGEALRESLAPQFLRSDVCAQLLRIKLLAGAKPFDGELARIGAFQYASEDPTLDGGFAFGRRNGVLTPHVNPVSTVFCLQALHYAKQAAENGLNRADWRKLI